MTSHTCEHDGTMTEYVFGSIWERRWSFTSLTLARAIRAFYVRTLFPDTYSTAPTGKTDAPHELGIGSHLYTGSEPGAVVEVCVVLKRVPDERVRGAARKAMEAGQHFWENQLSATRAGHWTNDRVVVAKISPSAPDGDDASPALLQAQMAMAGGSASTALQPAGVDTGLQSRGRTDMERGALDLAEKMNEIERMKNELQQQRFELQRQVEGMRKEMERRLEQIWLIELFLGSKEQVRLLRDGAAAPPDTPITVRQQVLCMDEEMAVYTWLRDPERIGEFTWKNLRDFDNWLLEDPGHLDAIFPHQKGIIGLRVRHRKYSLGPDVHLMDQISEDEANSMTYMLVRNGEQLYRLWVDVSLWPRLFSSDADVERWSKLAKTSSSRDKDSVRREFMRYIGGLMVLEGLLKRSDLLHPLPIPELSCFNPHHIEHFAMVRDGERHAQLTDDTDSLAHLTWDWYREWMTKQLTHGMRVIWLGQIDGPTGDMNRRQGALYARTGINSIFTWPVRYGVYVLNGDGVPADSWYDYDTGWTFLYQPGDEVYSSDPYTYGSRPRQRRVRFTTTAREVLPVDLCSWRVLEHLLNDRSQRHIYADFMGAVFGWWKNMKAEEQRELPFVELAIRQAGLEVTDWNVAWGHRLVRWWKMKTKQHRDLSTDESKALRMIVKALGKIEDHLDDPEVTVLRAMRGRDRY